MIRAILVLLFFVIFFIGFLPALAVLFVLRFFNPWLERRVTLAIIRVFLRFELFVAGTSVEVSGLGNIPEDEAVLFVGNHRSYFDILVTYIHMKRPTGYIAKKSMAGIPIMSLWMDLLECLYLDRENIREGAKTIQQAIRKIGEGVSMFIFPEGTRNHNEDPNIPMEFKNGSLKIAQKSGCRIVPVAIRDTEKIFEAHFPFVRPAHVRVSFLTPLKTDDIPEEFKKNQGEYIRRLIADGLQKS